MKIRIFQIIFILFLIEKIKAKENNESKIVTIIKINLKPFLNFTLLTSFTIQ